MSIPKTIHYCWFGKNPKSEKIIRCMDSWREHLHDYDIIEWNESNCDITESSFTKSAYEAEKWAFVADYFRFKVLYEFGGIYLDTDMLINRSFDSFLGYDAFFSMECYKRVSGGVIGAALQCSVIKDIFDRYAGMTFENRDGTVCDQITGALVERYGYKKTGCTQILKDNIAVLAPNVFIVDVGDGANYSEHLYSADVSWANGEKNSGFSYKYTVLKRYFFNLFGRPMEKGKAIKTSDSLKNDADNMIANYGAVRIIWQIIKKSIYNLIKG